MDGICNPWVAEMLDAQPGILRDAGRVDIPVLLFQASEDLYVGPKAQKISCERAKKFRNEIVEGSRNEIWFERDENRLPQRKKVLRFFAKHTK